jgi:hypothetical protein
MSNKKSRFFVLRSPLLWVSLGLVITLIGLSVETAAHDPNDPSTTPPGLDNNEIRLTVNMNSGNIPQGLVRVCDGCNLLVGNSSINNNPQNVPVNKVWLTFYDGSNCITIYHNGNPIEVCGP